MICKKCGIEKEASKFRVTKWIKVGHESRCKQCRNLKMTIHRYKISEEFLVYLYTHDNCMCCGVEFSNSFDRCLHHTDEGVQGLVCRKCNYVLGADDDEALRTLDCVLSYMKQDRDVLCLISELPRIKKEHTRTVTKDSLGEQCNSCKGFYTRGSFYTDCRVRRDVCWDCNRGRLRLKISKPTKEAKQKTTHCECCNSELTEKMVHHVGDVAYGIICRRCNVLLKDESKEQIDRLLSAKLWIEQESLEWVMA